MKMNCWELKKCGRELNGSHVGEFGVCPVSVESSLDGTHGGRNAGRACWVVEGSMCGGRLQGAFAQKYQNCTKCDFYLRVKQEEGLNLQMSIILIKRIIDTEPCAPDFQQEYA